MNRYFCGCFTSSLSSFAQVLPEEPFSSRFFTELIAPPGVQLSYTVVPASRPAASDRGDVRAVLGQLLVDGVDLDSDLRVEHAHTLLDYDVRILDARVHLTNKVPGSSTWVAGPSGSSAISGRPKPRGGDAAVALRKC